MTTSQGISEMEWVKVLYANGTTMMYSMFPYEIYNEGRLAGYIVGMRDLNWFEKFWVRLMGL